MPKFKHDILRNLRSNSVTRQVTFDLTKIGGKSQNSKKFKCDILSNLQTMCPRIITKSTGSIFRQYLIFYGQNMKEIWHHLIFVMRCQDPLKCAASQNSSVTHCDKISNFVHMLKFGSFKFSRAFSRFGIFNYIPALFSEKIRIEKCGKIPNCQKVREVEIPQMSKSNFGHLCCFFNWFYER